MAVGQASGLPMLRLNSASEPPLRIRHRAPNRFFCFVVQCSRIATAFRVWKYAAQLQNIFLTGHAVSLGIGDQQQGFRKKFHGLVALVYLSRLV